MINLRISCFYYDPNEENFSPPVKVSKEDLEVVEADLSDIEQICKTVNEAYKKDVFRQGTRVTLEKVEKYFLSNQHIWYLVKKNTEVIATVMYSTDKAPESSQQGSVHMLAVKAEYQGKGLSAKLLKRIEAKALSEGKSTVLLIAAKINDRLCAFYQKNDYLSTGETFILPNYCVTSEYRVGEDPSSKSKIVYQFMKKALV